MSRIILRISLAFLSSGLQLPARPQAASVPTAQDVLASTLADLRGVSETIETSRPEDRMERSALWFSILNDPTVSIARLDSVHLPAQQRPSQWTILAKRLRHRAPKAARQSYKKAAKLSGGKHIEQAAKELEKALAIDPDFAEAHDALGVAYAQLQRYPEAAQEFRRTIELIPDESHPHSNLAWVLYEMGQRAEAEISVRRAIQLSPDNAAAHLLIGRLLVERPDTFAEGLGHLQYAARSMPEAERMAKALRRQ
jgi:tetratricopeptide (TPR) repeat protein